MIMNWKFGSIAEAVEMILKVSMTILLVVMGAGSAFGQVTLGDGTVVANEALADLHNFDPEIPGMGIVTNPENAVDLDPGTFASLDFQNTFVLAGERTIFEVSWSGMTVANIAGDDIMVGEEGSEEGSMIAAKVGGIWTGFLFSPSAVDTVTGGFYTRYDLSNMGVAENATVEALRISNVLDFAQQTQDDFGNTIFGNGPGGVGFTLDKTDSDPRYIAFLGNEFAAADFTEDGVVDAADLAQWQGDFGLNPDSDADDDGDSDGADFLVWQRQYEGTPQLVANTHPVPEPNTALLFFAAFASVVAFRMR